MVYVVLTVGRVIDPLHEPRYFSENLLCFLIDRLGCWQKIEFFCILSHYKLIRLECKREKYFVSTGVFQCIKLDSPHSGANVAWICVADTQINMLDVAE